MSNFSLRINYLLSYPRSGNTWLRYCIEHLTGKHTEGYNNTSHKFDMFGVFPENMPKISKTDNKGTFYRGAKIYLNEKDLPILIKRHETGEIRRNEKARVMLLIRDYRECIVSQTSQTAGLEPHIDNYMQLLQYYDSFSGKKIHIYYEDLITNIEAQIRVALHFLEEEVNEDAVCEFMDNIDYHHKSCMSLYGDSKSDGKSIRSHQKQLTHSEILHYKEYTVDRFPNIAKTYLSRYITEELNKDD